MKYEGNIRALALLCETLYDVVEIEDDIAYYETYSGKEEIIGKRPVTDFELIFTVSSKDGKTERRVLYTRNEEFEDVGITVGLWLREREYGLLEFSNPEEVFTLEEFYDELLKMYGSRIKQPMYVPFGDGYKTDIYIDGIEFQVFTDWGFVEIMPENVKDKEKGNEYIREIVRHFKNTPELIKIYKEKYPYPI